MQHAVSSSDLIRQFIPALVDSVQIPHVLKVVDNMVELLADLLQLLDWIHQTMLRYVYHLGLEN